MDENVWFTVYVVLAAAVIGALSMVGLWLREKARTSRAFLVMEQVWALTQAVVAHVDAKIRPTLKSALADGRLDKTEREHIQAEALRLVKEGLGEHGLAKMQKALGVGGNVEVFLSGLLERAFRTSRTDIGPPPGAKVKTIVPPPAVPPVVRP